MHIFTPELVIVQGFFILWTLGTFLVVMSLTLRITMTVRLLFVLSVLHWSSNLYSQSDSLAKRIDRIISNFTERGFSGSITIDHNDQTILKKGYGYGNYEQEVPFHVDMVFSIGTLSEQFNATLVLQQVEKGTLALTDTLKNIFPRKNIPDDKKNITIHQLLTHTAGLPDFVNKDTDYEKIQREKMLDQILDAKMLYKPGTRFSYSNAGYTLLAIILEEIGHRSYLEMLRELMKSAGMSSSGITGDKKWSENMVAKGYGFLKKGSNTVLDWPAPLYNLIGTGEIISNTNDLMLWLKSYTDQRVVAANTFELMTKQHALDKTQRFIHYGYGWKMRNQDNLKLIFYSGGGEYGQLASVRIYPDLNIRMVILSNTFQNVNPLASTMIGQIEKLFLTQM